LQVYELKEGKIVHDFERQKGKTYRQTEGFKRRYLYEGCSQRSYRLVAASYEKECFQEVKCSYRSMQSMVVQAGVSITKAIEKKSQTILEDYEIECKDDEVKVSPSLISSAKKKHLMDKKQVKKVFKELKKDSPKHIEKYLDEMKIDYEAYEEIDQTINISNDDVCTKRQKAERKELSSTEQAVEQAEKKAERQRSGGRKNQKKRKLLYHNCTHFEYKNQQYQLVGQSLSKQVGCIISFLLHNSGLEKNWVFYVDGQRTIYKCIHKRFWWKPVVLILDWYHLHKRLCKQMYYALKTCERRDEIQLRLRDYLWYGLTTQAIKYIDEIEEGVIKNQENLNNLKKYIERNESYIKNYALRKQLGLRLSSNRVEKTNDQLVSVRQKKNGMSFTRNGSQGLALMTCINKNEEQIPWLRNGAIPFKFVA